MLAHLFFLLDAWLIAPFRWPASPILGFFLGTCLLALYSIFLGQLSMAGLARIQYKHRVKHDTEVAKRSALSLEALKVQDKEAYLAQNTLAKDAYGHVMSLAVGRMTASLWPAVAALAWMDLRFRGVPLELPFSVPYLGANVYYPFFFIPMYLGLRIAWSTLRKRGKARTS
ncbi:hypothetical protein MASR1M90_09670 [Desulfovibrionales bacterium]